MTQLKLFNSLTREIEPFVPVHQGEARVYSCGPTVYNYQHIGNMRAYIFADTLGRTLQYKGYKLTHVINITDVGHLTSDADEGEDKMEKMAATQGKSAWDIAAFYQADFEADLARLNVQQKQHPRATEYVEEMIEWGKSIADKHCYELESGLYFDISTVADYGKLARAVTEEGEGRIEKLEGKRNAGDFAIWRKTPEGETRQMEWDSPWGKGAPGWHLECSVMGEKLLGFPFDIHTGGIDHREIHHPNEIAQNQAFCGCGGLSEARNSGANIWMHNNFLVERSGKMSKSSGEFLRLQLLVDKGYHPLAYRMMCLQAHYRSELEFSWEGLEAALTRLKRMVMGIERLKNGLGAEWSPTTLDWILSSNEEGFEGAICDDLNTPRALTEFEDLLFNKKIKADEKVDALRRMDFVLGLDLFELSREDLRIRPVSAEITEDKIEDALARRKAARAEKDFATSDAIRDELAATGVEVMDGDPLGWDWKLA
ncbi:cysteine--tRNA ligase [Erythrobacter sp. SCSIO 43205]|uniref:cysteine--tRNA ligase n=1 Tax=Erythrobacter sp. SCSIO 43205 TaxID=2779361 RepID=UPI001CA9F8B2|nr:cysteine--tRNA ligase [Erythrobacter sp. SCSIO 43205]UAB77707.1 cysteine--tRNA ligase [Erythrobacter sp. SCSIO 43205]